MVQNRSALLLSLCGALLALPACDGAEPKNAEPVAKETKTEAKAADALIECGTIEPSRDALEGAPTEAILLSQAWFYKCLPADKPKSKAKSKPGPARLQIFVPLQLRASHFRFGFGNCDEDDEDNEDAEDEL